MRLTLPRQKTKIAGSLETYLSNLKATQLQSIARATGIPSSGRKDELRQRIHEELLTSCFLSERRRRRQWRHENEFEGEDNVRQRRDGSANDIPTTSSSSSKKQQEREWVMSILSIDMGIQNLAFAHLIVQPARHQYVADGDGDDAQKSRGSITLNAWHRIAVQELPAASSLKKTQAQDHLRCSTGAEAVVDLQQILPPSVFRTFTSRAAANGTTKLKKENANFDPDNLARHAFVLLYSLLQAYKPTHILIERQRFRSAGQSAVLEWSLRVGVFEGMLHAVLSTMRELSRFDDSQGPSNNNAQYLARNLEVYTVSPARVMQSWDDSARFDNSTDIKNTDASQSRKNGTLTQKQRNVKRIKMDIVGDILAASSGLLQAGEERRRLSCWDVGIASSSSSTTIQTDEPRGFETKGVNDVVDAFLRRWNPRLYNANTHDSATVSTTTKKRTKSSSAQQQMNSMDKIDDLADCFLQGVTWLEWQAKRARIVARNKS